MIVIIKLIFTFSVPFFVVSKEKINYTNVYDLYTIWYVYFLFFHINIKNEYKTEEIQSIWFVQINSISTSDGNYSSIRIFDHSNISIRCYNTIRNKNYSFKFSRNTKRLLIILYGLWCIKAYKKWIWSQWYLLFDMAIKIQK
jgi:hypothetical protein